MPTGTKEIARTVWLAPRRKSGLRKYAGASRATVRVANGADGLRFEVADDGCGFDPSATGHGMGLQGMADRLEALGGALEIRSQPGEGTTLTGRIPTRTVRLAAVGGVAEPDPESVAARE